TTVRLTQQLDEASGNLADRIGETSDRLSGQLQETSRAIVDQLGSATHELDDRLGSMSSEVIGRFDNVSRHVTERLEEASAQLAGRLDETTGRLYEHVNRSHASVADRFSATTQELEASLDRIGTSMFSRIEATAQDLGERFDTAAKALENVTSDINNRFEGTSAHFTQLLTSTSNSVISELNNANAAFADGLQDSMQALTGRFELGTGGFIDRITRAASDFDTKSAETAQQLDQAGSKFGHHVDTAAAFLAERLSEAARGLDGELEDVTLKLTARLESTSGKLAGRLEETSSVVETAVNRFTSEVDRVLENRENLLGDLTAKLGARAAEIDTHMRSYVKLVEDSLSGVHGRADELGRTLSKQAAQATQLLQTELRRIEQASDSQAAQVAKALREHHEKLGTSMGTMLAASARDFASTAQEMRGAAQQVVKDIEAARNELRKSAAELPEETRSNADAMRKVVADQIAALSALADVVKRQTGLTDLSGPGVHMAAPRETGPGKSEGPAASLSRTAEAPKERPGRITEASIQPQRAVPSEKRAPIAPKRPAEPAASAMKLSSEQAPIAPKRPAEPAVSAMNHPSQQTPIAPKRPAEPAVEMPMPSPFSYRPETPKASVRGRSVDALLKAPAETASADLLPKLAEEAKRAAPAAADATTASLSSRTEMLVTRLNSIARDLLEAVEGTLSGDLERRFNNGETHVYTHRLYQSRSNRLFEDIRGRYGKERLVRGRVDAFIRLFERLLDTVAEAPKGDELVDACLSSESGKVYLLLAQATGRIET
ncbi:MAG: hypothetical protein AB7S41_00815, partial [Parvibaculaceae bacterium]